MNPQRIFGILLLAIGLILLFLGMTASQSIADQMSNTFTGRFSDRTLWYMVGGLALGIAGVSMVVLAPRGDNA